MGRVVCKLPDDNYLARFSLPVKAKRRQPVQDRSDTRLRPQIRKKNPEGRGFFPDNNHQVLEADAKIAFKLHAWLYGDNTASQVNKFKISGLCNNLLIVR
jgi:hypothetical protein